MNTLSITEPSMEFLLDEAQQSIVQLAGEIFSSLSNDENNVVNQRSGRSFDENLWTELIEAGLLEALLPDDVGPGLGTVGLALLAKEQGRSLARIPLIPTAVAALALAQFQGHSQLLEKIGSGTARVGILLPEVQHRIDAQRTENGWQLHGRIQYGYMVPAMTHLLVQFTDQGVEHMVIIETERAGLGIETFEGISYLQHAELNFKAVQIQDRDLLGAHAAPGEVASWVRHRLVVTAAASIAGACEEAVRRTALYTSEREQFGRPLSTNQGVALRAADAYIDTQTTWLSTIDAAWQLDAGTADGTEAALGASWFAREAGFRTVHATQHLHGGMGADKDNHIHRFFVWVRELDQMWGTATQLLEELADTLLPRSSK
ncbi:acyl-CoA dehydrogenase family protein [Arthrobacter sp. MYb213]|uniref:acyl-CoA dehydrogenase family protein n=1 Tax=Arthrobacter sp. MYb213 TaxID=1848595 RepID=UPI000CFDA64A|nr:acyl-CoA dehydrogenase family protein [Arthrobacter sp. MYb213]PRB70395.1 acyl-CoA dehydrogenase [Arthrobacter sp. MYb213]